MIYIVEGEVEKKFLQNYMNNAKNKGKVTYFESGKIVIYNAFQDSNKAKLMGHLNVKRDVMLIIDTDLLEPHHINKYKKNIKFINANCKNLIIKIQKYNFEDEYIKMTNLNRKQLLDTYNVSSLNEFKTKYIKANNPSINIDFDKYCSSDCEDIYNLLN